MEAPLASILVVLDPAADGGALLAKAARLATGSGARLRLFCCDHDPRLVARLMLSPDALSAARAQHLRGRRKWLESLAAPLAAAGLAVEVEACWDAPLHAGILTEVSLARPGLVVKEAAWHAGLGRRLFGHADWRLLQSCPVPVLLTLPEAWPAAPRIAAAVDPGHPGDPAGVLDDAILQAGERLAGWLAGGLAAVHAYMTPDAAVLAALAGGLPPAPAPGAAAADLRAATEAALERLLAGHAVAGGAAQVIEGSAVEALPAWCAAEGIDVLAVGVTSRSRLAEAVIGSTAERLLERLPCDLLAVHGPGA